MLSHFGSSLIWSKVNLRWKDLTAITILKVEYVTYICLILTLIPRIGCSLRVVNHIRVFKFIYGDLSTWEIFVHILLVETAWLLSLNSHFVRLSQTDSCSACIMRISFPFFNRNTVADLYRKYFEMYLKRCFVLKTHHEKTSSLPVDIYESFMAIFVVTRGHFSCHSSHLIIQENIHRLASKYVKKLHIETMVF